MQRNNYAGKGGMAFTLGLTVQALIYHLEDPLNARINHIALIYSEIQAILTADSADKKPSQEDLEVLKTIASDIETLRDSYEPILDDSNHATQSRLKLSACEKMLDMIRLNLLYIIEKYKLVNLSMMKDIQGITWDNLEEN